MRTFRLPVLSAALAASLLVGSAAAQQADPSIRVRGAPAPHPELRGVVVDSATGQPIVVARLEIERLNARVYSDEQGAFAIGRLPERAELLVVRALGYRPAAHLVRPSRTGEPLRIALVPQPTELAALHAVYDMFEARRRASPYVSRVFRRTDLALSAAPNMLNFLRTRGAVQLRNCAWGRAGLAGCQFSRGSWSGAAIFLDGAPLIGGIESLETYGPEEIERVEIYRAGKIVYLYSTWYMERAVRRRMPPQPIIIS